MNMIENRKRNLQTGNVSNRKAMNRNWSNQKANPALKKVIEKQ